MPPLSASSRKGAQASSPLGDCCEAFFLAAQGVPLPRAAHRDRPRPNPRPCRVLASGPPSIARRCIGHISAWWFRRGPGGARRCDHWKSDLRSTCCARLALTGGAGDRRPREFARAAGRARRRRRRGCGWRSMGRAVRAPRISAAGCAIDVRVLDSVSAPAAISLPKCARISSAVIGQHRADRFGGRGYIEAAKRLPFIDARHLPRELV